MRRGIRIALAVAAGLVVLAGVVGLGLWRDRPDPVVLGVPAAPAEPAGAGQRPTLTWLGVTTLLIDDGETRLLTDGFFSRPGLLEVVLDRHIEPDRAAIDSALARFGIRELAAVMPVHSHFDHALDTAEVALRTGARVLGSASTANLARGAGVPEDRIQVVGDGESYRFGRFTVTFFGSRHWPATADGLPPMPGSIDAPLVPPAAMSAWREGGSYSIHVAHPGGSVLVQGSAGYVEGKLAGVSADVVVLGVGGLSRSGRDHAARYWAEIVGRSDPARVHLVHWEDFTLPYGDLRAFPRMVDDLDESVAWLGELATESGVALERLPFGRPVSIRR